MFVRGHADLAVVRIYTYEQPYRGAGRGRRPVCVAAFQDGVKGYPRSERQARCKTHLNFTASHALRGVPAFSDLIGTYANVAGVPCEVQVCSMMAHVWNEIEHDLGYKPLTGELSELGEGIACFLRTPQQIWRWYDCSPSAAKSDSCQTEQTDSFADVFRFRGNGVRR